MFELDEADAMGLEGEEADDEGGEEVFEVLFGVSSRYNLWVCEYAPWNAVDHHPMCAADGMMSG